MRHKIKIQRDARATGLMTVVAQTAASLDVRVTAALPPGSRHLLALQYLSRRAMTPALQQREAYSITSSALTRSAVGMFKSECLGSLRSPLHNL